MRQEYKGRFYFAADMARLFVEDCQEKEGIKRYLTFLAPGTYALGLVLSALMIKDPETGMYKLWDPIEV